MTAQRTVLVAISLTAAILATPAAAQSRPDLEQRNRQLEEQVRQQQQEIEQLKARILELQAQPRPAAAAAAPAAPASRAPIHALAPIAAASAPLPVPPPGYKLVKIEPPAPNLPKIPSGYKLVKIPPPYSETGCHHGGAFSNGPDAPWKHEDPWLSLQVGMTPQEVEKLLSKEHFDIRDGDRTGWEYGKCGKAFWGIVVFSDGKVAYWKKPYF
ncbi:MAG: hypothetical protein KGJ55_08470 [Gammaproteobacteria bacterium]|nr:hypothetical protein [Gammaproteobacteria bacterium]